MVAEKEKLTENQSNLAIVTSEFSNTCGCIPHCLYFPNAEYTEWVYDENEPYIKRRKEAKNFVCKYDGHVITSWTDEICPKKVDQLNKIEIDEDNEDE